MSYTILTAKYANADKTAVVIMTQEAGAVAVSQQDRPELWEMLLDWIDLGNTPEPADVPSAEEIAAAARIALDEQERQQAKLDTAILALINATPVQLVTYARANFPSLTLAEQNKIGVILNILAVATRGELR